MSEVTRYTAAGDRVVKADSAGPLVKWEDYANLRAEVERLRKAGDAMVPLLGRGDYHDARIEWNAAKEGKQS